MLTILCITKIYSGLAPYKSDYLKLGYTNIQKILRYLYREKQPTAIFYTVS